MISPRRVRSATPKAAITPRLRCFYIAPSCCTRSRWFFVALYLRASATGFHWGRASRWSQVALMVCAFVVVLTMVTMGYTRETARRVDNDPAYLINGCVKLDQTIVKEGCPTTPIMEGKGG